MTIREEMTNGFKIAHGGITFSFADSAFAFASNSRGRKAVSIETSISHTKPLKIGDIITAIAEEQSLCLLYTSPSPRDATLSRMPSSA